MTEVLFYPANGPPCKEGRADAPSNACLRILDEFGASSMCEPCKRAVRMATRFQLSDVPLPPLQLPPPRARPVANALPDWVGTAWDRRDEYEHAGRR